MTFFIRKKDKEKEIIEKRKHILGVILIVAGNLISQYPKLTDFLFRQEAKEKKEEFEKEKRNSKIKVEELYHELVKRNEALYASLNVQKFAEAGQRACFGKRLLQM